MHLPQLIDAIHEVKNVSITPYLDHNRQKICQHCDLLHTDVCPCPLDYLAVLVVEAVETVDQRRQQQMEQAANEYRRWVLTGAQTADDESAQASRCERHGPAPWSAFP